MHRDLEPANSFVSGDIDGAFAVKRLDFGLAKFLDGCVSTTSAIHMRAQQRGARFVRTQRARPPRPAQRAGTAVREMIATPLVTVTVAGVCCRLLEGRDPLAPQEP